MSGAFMWLCHVNGLLCGHAVNSTWLAPRQNDWTSFRIVQLFVLSTKPYKLIHYTTAHPIKHLQHIGIVVSRRNE